MKISSIAEPQPIFCKYTQKLTLIAFATFKNNNTAELCQSQSAVRMSFVGNCLFRLLLGAIRKRRCGQLYRA